MERLKDLRKSKNMTQAQLAEKLNVSQKTISKYELGITEPTIPVLISAARLFEVSTDYLLGLDTPYLTDLWKTRFNKDEMRLIEAYRYLSDDNRIIALGEVLKLEKDGKFPSIMRPESSRFS